jgi:hypothetical protein
MALEGSGPQFSKLGCTTKMGLQVDSSNVFHLESTKIEKKLYDDPIQIRATLRRTKLW